MESNGRNGQILPKIPTSWLILSTLVIISIVVLFALMMLYPRVLLILFAGLFLGVAIKPAVDWMARHKIPQEVGAALIFISILAILGLFIAYVLPLLLMQTVNLTAALSEGYIQVRQNLLTGSGLLLYQVVRNLPEDIQLLQPAFSLSTEAGEGNVLEGVGVVLGQVFGTGLGVIFVFFLAVNWSVEGDRFLRSALLLSNQRREFMRETFLDLEKRISRYLTGLGLLSLIVGTMALIGYLLIGLPYAVILAVFAGIMEAVPVIGPTLGAVPAIIIALSVSPGAAIAVIVVTVLIQAAENIWIFPRVMGSSVGVPPFLTLIAMLIFTTLFGVIGALIAIPVTAVAKVVSDVVIDYLRSQRGEAIGRDRLGALRYDLHELVSDIRSQSRNRDLLERRELFELEDSLEAIALDLDALLEQPSSEVEE